MSIGTLLKNQSTTASENEPIYPKTLHGFQGWIDTTLGVIWIQETRESEMKAMNTEWKGLKISLV